MREGTITFSSRSALHILHQLGLDHRDLVMVREGRSEHLTDDFPAQVVKEILA